MLFLLFSFSPSKPFLSKFIYSASVFILQVGLTHVYRSIIIRNKWQELSIKKNIVRTLISSIILSLTIESVLMLLLDLLKLADMNDMKFNRLFIYYSNRSFVNFAWSVIYFAVHYFESYSSAQLDKLKYEMLLKDFELKVLKSQMNPHFIFNALNSISGLINENPRKAQFSLSQLSSLLRYSLMVNKKETVPLEEEMQIVNDYLELESIRYEERLKVILDIDPSSLKIPIPPMMIQTLCENGIKHGISRLPNGGELCVKSSISGNNLVVEIKNSGIIQNNVDSEENFGLRNTRQRLFLLYGNNASFQLKNTSGNTVSAELVIPIRDEYEKSINN
ncbi:MAG: sensor histidine kinase [Ignavibacteriales bacterium]